jgi:hypothetical protein
MGWRIALWILLSLCGIVSVLIFVPVGIKLRYRNEELKMWVALGPIRILLYPKGKTVGKEKKEQKETKISVRTVFREPIRANRKYDSLLGDFLAELKTALELFWDLRPRLCIKRLKLKLILGGGDPCSLALQYGGAWAALGAVFPILDGGFTVKKHDISVDCDFSEGSRTTLDGELYLTIGLGRLLARLFRFTMDRSSTDPKN